MTSDRPAAPPESPAPPAHPASLAASPESPASPAASPESPASPVGAASCRPHPAAPPESPASPLDTDTIVAVATGTSSIGGYNWSDGAIAVIRISGPDAFRIAGRIFRGKKPFDSIKPYTIGYGSIFEPAESPASLAASPESPASPVGAASCRPHPAAPPESPTTPVGAGFHPRPHPAAVPVDETLILKMRAPKSYTCEDVVEIHCHAGAEILRRILRIVMREGARAAEPGEFTKRAFLNGRVDLSQAEAVMDLIRAKSETGATLAMRQLEGALSGRLHAVRDALIGLIASLEAFLDFPEHDVDEQDASAVFETLHDIENSVTGLADSFTYGRAARDGVDAVIAGRPNVGKSTLLNLIAGRERAIVTEIPGTTRDVIDEYKNLGGFSVRFLDTAGIRDTDDAVERIGVAKSIDALERADLALLLFSADEGFTEDDARLIRLAYGKRRIFIINKTDLADARALNAFRSAVAQCAASPPAPPTPSSASLVGAASCRPHPATPPESSTSPVGAGFHPRPHPAPPTPPSPDHVIEASLISGMGFDAIEDAIRDIYAGQSTPGFDDAVLTNERHYSLVLHALDSLRAAGRALKAGLPFEISIIDMRDALASLGEITGETFSDDIIDKIFSEFCIGK